jgi:dinuclear metal center YbgI/SA1388 family protein
MADLTVGDLERAMGEISPLRLAEAWDNVGLLLGDSAWGLRGGVLLTIDLTEAVAEEAVRLGVGAVLAYHPPIFSAVKRLACGPQCGGRSRALVKLMGEKVAVYSPHTALDAATGGVTEWLLGVAVPGVERVRAISAHTPKGAEYKVVVFVPTDPPGLIDELRGAMAGAGAGEIGAYSSCSFAVPGVGTFVGGEGSNPVVGERGRLEHVTELRLEMVCAGRCLAAVLGALRAVHPYEEPAFDVVKLEGRADERVGAGRIGEVSGGVTAVEVARRLKSALAVRGASPASVLVASPPRGGMEKEKVSVVAAVPGSGGSLLDEAVGMGCRLFITGEMKHHEVLGAVDRGCSVVLAGHTETERGFLPVLRERLEGMGVRAVVSLEDGAVLRSVG